MAVENNSLIIQSPSLGRFNIAYTTISLKSNSFKVSTIAHTNGSNKPIIRAFLDVEGTDSPYIKVKIGSEGLTKDVRDFLNAQNTLREKLTITYGNNKILAIMEQVPEITFPRKEMEITFLEVNE